MATEGETIQTPRGTFVEYDCKHCGRRGSADKDCCRMAAGIPLNSSCYARCCACEGAGKILKRIA